MSVHFKTRPVVAYFPMWHDQQNWSNPAQSRLAKVNASVNIVILSFVDPAKSYNGSLDAPISDYFFEGEGKALADVTSLQDLKVAIRLCKENGIDRRVLISAGGEIGGEFINPDFDSLARLIADLELDGLDLDYEPAGGMTQTAEHITIYQNIISGARLALDATSKNTGKDYVLTCAPTGVGLVGDNETKPDFITQVSERLKPFINKEEQSKELFIGTIQDDPADLKNSALSIYNFDSAGKMHDVFLKKSGHSDYLYIGNMVDIVIYQAYNMGSANLLGRALCYESHRRISEQLQNESGQPGFAIMHGSHIGQEAFPRYAHTLNRLTSIYSYICQYGRENDGASFWAYEQDPVDTQSYVPKHGMGYSKSYEVFDAIALLHANYATVAPQIELGK